MFILSYNVIAQLLCFIFVSLYFLPCFQSTWLMTLCDTDGHNAFVPLPKIPFLCKKQFSLDSLILWSNVTYHSVPILTAKIVCGELLAVLKRHTQL